MVSFKTSSTILSFFLTMALNPEVMSKAQAEIDRVTKVERLPTLDDRSELPYIDGVVKEVYRYELNYDILVNVQSSFRFHPPGPLGMILLTDDHDCLQQAPKNRCTPRCH